MRTHDLSQHVHRIGYHFPSDVVATICMDLGLYLTTSGKVVPFYNDGSGITHRHSESDASQITINTEARDVIRDLFPNIPTSDLNQIIKTAFQKVWLPASFIQSYKGRWLIPEYPGWIGPTKSRHCS